jgi:hypothetical protein
MLAQVAAELTQAYQVQAQFLAVDLAVPGAAGRVAEWAKAQTSELGVLINNAGYGLWGRFEELPLADQQNMLQLNMLVPTELTHHLLPLLRQQPKAYILNVASTAAYQAVPTLSLYAASKAFLLTFSRGLRYELRGTPVSVTCLSPGATITDFPNRAGMNADLQATANKFGMTAEDVSRIGITAMLAGEAEIIPGALNKISAKLTGFVPKSVTEKIAAGLYEKHLK